MRSSSPLATAEEDVALAPERDDGALKRASGHLRGEPVRGGAGDESGDLTGNQAVGRAPDVLGLDVVAHVAAGCAERDDVRARTREAESVETRPRGARLGGGGLVPPLGDLRQRGEPEHVVGHVRRGRLQRFVLALDQAGVEVRRGERLRPHQPPEKLEVRGHADDLVGGERIAHQAERLGAIGAAHDQLGDHRVVVGGDGVALLHAGVDAHLGRRRGRREVHQLAHRRREAGVGILGVHARLDGVADGPQCVICACRSRQGLACRDHVQLPLDQIESLRMIILGDRVLDLQARVHLHEVEMSTRLDDEAPPSRRPRSPPSWPPARRWRPSARASRRAGPAPAPLPAPSGAAFAPSNRARRGARGDRGCRRRPALRRGAGARCTFPGGPSGRRRSWPPRAGRRRGWRRTPPPGPPGACPCRRPRRSP